MCFICREKNDKVYKIQTIGKKAFCNWYVIKSSLPSTVSAVYCKAYAEITVLVTP
jgi:hypothetical protein